MKTLFIAALLLAAPAGLQSVQANDVPLHFADAKAPVLTAQQVLDKHVEALGGPEKISALKTVVVKQTASAQNQEIPQTLYILSGQGVRSEINAMGIQIVMAARADSGWQINPALYGNRQPVALSAQHAKSACAQADLFGPLVTAHTKGYAVTNDGDEKVDGEPCYKLGVTLPSGGHYTAFVSQKTYMLLKMVTKNSEVYYSDYRNVDGYWFPHQVEVISGGNKASLIDRSFDVNKPLDDALFTMPTAN